MVFSLSKDSQMWSIVLSSYWYFLTEGEIRVKSKSKLLPVHTNSSYLYFKNTRPLLDIAELPVGQLFHTKYVAAYFLLLSSIVSETCTILARLLALYDVLVVCLATGVV